ncbi:concanavalin A-like lectin/glucanase domain-containing protein [Auriculariales sp. MPI-PUGE-AT-0066]|nr:concanavalin A-like lectin/glucanase domain-containing protein [Auriculariales sp. MPI-PUGE-AT-0066]
MSTVVQLQVLGSTEIETCQTMSLGWSGGSEDQLQNRFNLYIMREADANGSPTSGADGAVETVPIGQTTLQDLSFRWLRVVVGPGSYVVNATKTSSTSLILFLPTAAFSVSAGSDTSCLVYFTEGLSSTTSPNLSSPTITDAPPGPSPQKSNTAVIAGGSVAGVALLILVAGILWYWLKRRRNAPVAVRTRTVSYSSASSHNKVPSFPSPSPNQSIPLVMIMPSSPRTPMGTYQRQLPVAHPSQPVATPDQRPPNSSGYAESTVQSDDSFAEERDALREEFQISDGTTSAGGARRNGRPFSAVQSSVASDMEVGPDGRPAGHERKPKPLTFAVSNPDHTVWEEGAIDVATFMLSAQTFFTIFIAALGARGACECGYIDSNNRVWREGIESDFTVLAGALSVVNKDWSVQTWTGAGGGSALARQNVAANVFQYQDALGLRTSKYDNSGTTKIAEIDTKRSDIQYGSFRTRAQVPHVPGVCFGFFTYNGAASPVKEVDIEFLSADSDYYQRVHYTNQPGSVNGVIDPQAYHPITISGADFTTFGEHRFDWIPGRTTFYYNGAQMDTITKNVPSVGSTFITNVWSNGDPGWTKGPPTADAIATLQYIKLYFNSTSLGETAFNQRCVAAGNVAKCRI